MGRVGNDLRAKLSKIGRSRGMSHSATKWQARRFAPSSFVATSNKKKYFSKAKTLACAPNLYSDVLIFVVFALWVIYFALTRLL
jgi:hypothetical protein